MTNPGEAELRLLQRYFFKRIGDVFISYLAHFAPCPANMLTEEGLTKEELEDFIASCFLEKYPQANMQQGIKDHIKQWFKMQDWDTIKKQWEILYDQKSTIGDDVDWIGLIKSQLTLVD